MGIGFQASATFTPAAASHVAGDVHGGAKEFANIGDPGSYVKILSGSLRIDGATIETTAWTLHLYDVTPPSAIADDGAWDVPSGDRSAYLGSVAFAQVVDLGSTLFIATDSINKVVKLASGSRSLFGYLVNGTTLTPAAVGHVVKLVTELVAP